MPAQRGKCKGDRHLAGSGPAQSHKASSRLNQSHGAQSHEAQAHGAQAHKGRTPLVQPPLLPVCRADMDALGWTELDVLLVSGDAYVDHPAFGVPLLGRWLTAHGFRVGLVAQPRWTEAGPGPDIAAMGRPRLFAGVSAGALDSMLAHYTAFRKKRHDDAYTPGGKAGARPNRAVIVYAGLLRRAFPGLPILAGGIEASLRRITHSDFWTDSLRRSILFDARLDLLVCGMGERALLEAARRADALCDAIGPDQGWWPADWAADIPGTARIVDAPSPGASLPEGLVLLPSHEAMLAEPGKLVEGTRILEQESHQGRRGLLQVCKDKAVLLTPAAPPLSTAELDALYALPFSRKSHPAYSAPIPAQAMIATSLTTHRGCGGGCSFCSLALHQGRRIASRSQESILAEAARVAAMPGFTGAISDVGGPSANMWQTHCAFDPGRCVRASCLFPSPCKGFAADQRSCVALLRAVRELPGVRHVRVASGVRFDMALEDPQALAAYAGEFTGGQLKIAPEHCADTVLRLMRKPGLPLFEAFMDAFARICRAEGKEQYVIPYLMSGFPGCTDDDMRRLAAWLRARNWSPRQVQCFIPTPGSMATAMFYAETDPDGVPLFVARSDAARLRQHAILLGDEAGRNDKAERKPAHGSRPGPDRKPQRPFRTPKSAGQNAPPEQARKSGQDRNSGRIAGRPAGRTDGPRPDGRPAGPGPKKGSSPNREQGSHPGSRSRGRS